MKLKKIMLFGNDRKSRHLTVNADDGLPRFFEDEERRVYERFNALSAAETVRYCEVTVHRLSKFVAGGTVDV
jgi:preprotein translocase subunit Sec61beta